jgi:NADP oxidoreductase coenzyme F420-dependent
MTTAVIGTGTLGSVIARLLASGGETLRLSSADDRSARTLAAEIGPAAAVADENRDALQGADAVVLALRFTALRGVVDEIADLLTDKLVVVPSNPLGISSVGPCARMGSTTPSDPDRASSFLNIRLNLTKPKQYQALLPAPGPGSRCGLAAAVASDLSGCDRTFSRRRGSFDGNSTDFREPGRSDPGPDRSLRAGVQGSGRRLQGSSPGVAASVF